MTELGFHARRPAAALAPYVAELMGYAYAGAPPALHRGLPSRHLTLVLTLDEPLGICWPGRPVEKLQALAGGLHETAVRIGETANVSGVQLALTPAGSRALLGVPAAELSGRVIDLEDVVGSGVRSLTDRLAGLPSWERRFAVVEGFLLDVAGRRSAAVLRDPAPELGWAWQRLGDTDGGVAVQRLATDVGWSRRHLTARFRDEYGLVPKVAARVLRFEHAVGRLKRMPGSRLADIAADAGYADQAHLSREWQALAGCSPRQWMREDLPFLQDTADPDEHGGRSSTGVPRATGEAS